MRLRIILFLLLTFSSIQVSGVDKKPIEVLLTSDNSIYEQALFGIQTSINHEIHINYLDIIDSEYESQATYFQELENKGVPLIITIGKGATRAAQEYTHKLPILFSMISYAKSLDLESSNICGVTMDVPVESFLNVLKDIYPDAKTVYSFYSNEEGEFSSEEGEHADLKNRLLFMKKKTTPESFKKDLNEMQKHPDALFISSDPLYNSENFETISEFSKKNSIILMSSFPALVKSGATFGISADYTKIGIETGEMANAIIGGNSNCEKERVHLPKHFNFLLNENFAKESKIKIPTLIQERAKKSRLFSIGLQLLNEGKWKSSKVIFESILKDDPMNQSAIVYQQLTVEKLSGSLVRDILQKAKNFSEAGNYSSAKAEYQKALSLNPNLVLAREGVQNSLISQSEKERQKAILQRNQGHIFEAIRSFLDSLHTYPQNTNAKNELEALRKKEFGQVSSLTPEGIQEYQNRNYDTAIDNFEKVLLLDPGDKTAIEYLRLSIKRREAIRNLEKRLK
ncbi:peptide ABC transporter substrate-binding protein [Leptospira ognonensis]|uniref:Peptide ABC transporter substrate-binding protein n=1 Tax=Leptospira ognonensis TaxID=2484945 RepID=A0A4R9JXP8_9LEPT|nr:ABC transporter substrate binding protein [Leptospira ognonensis]TGL57981.1 peptide ABC transporter substrate-binding protein [Leptospira ognonensis]